MPKGRYGKNLATLMSGTALAQLIPLAVIPVLTRIYTPQEFGAFALYVAVVSVFSIIVTGRYELAIMVPESDDEALLILVLAVLLSFILSLLLFLVVVVGLLVARTLGHPGVGIAWLYIVPLSTFAIGCYQSLNYWSNRQSFYKGMAASRVIQSGSAGFAQLTMGFLKLGVVGLVVGQLVGQCVAATYLARKLILSENKHLKNVDFRQVRYVGTKYINFPKYLTFSHCVNRGSTHAPVVLLNSFFTTALAGLYMLTDKVLMAPIGLVATAVGDVFRQEASVVYAKENQCKRVYIKTFFRLVLISIIPFTVFFFVAEELFSFVFGHEWAGSGAVAKILTPMFFFRFVAGPLTFMFMISEAQRIDLIWQLCLMLLVVASFFVGSYFEDYHLSLMLFSASYSLMYAISLILSYRLASGKNVILNNVKG
tara:strand:- start:12093 stop:13367 length:1275 start_codon:yes stop_codon:yes gene_type:complete